MTPTRTALPAQKDAAETARTLHTIHDHLRTEMARAQMRHQEYADRKRTPAPTLRIGDRVWLNAKNVTTTRSSQKLDHRRLGPFTIIEVVSDWAYRLDFPKDIRMHSVQHVSLLDPVAEDPLPGQVAPPPPPVEIHGEEEYTVEEILDSRTRWRRLEYLVKWKGYDETIWEKATNVDELQTIDSFHEQYPDKPGPLPDNVS